MAKTPTDIRSLARSHTEAAISTLAGVMRQKNATAAARVSAAIALLDRGWGKPVQAIEVDRMDRPVEELTDEEITFFLRQCQKEKAASSGDNRNA